MHNFGEKMFKSFIITFVLLVSADCANILVLESFISDSDQLWIKTIVMELARRGHNVTSLSANVEDSGGLNNLHYIHVENILTWIDQEKSLKSLENESDNPWHLIQKYGDFIAHYSNQVVKSKGFHRLLNYPEDFKFDLIIYDYASSPIVIGFVHQFNYPSLATVSAANYVGDAGALTGTFLYPSIYQHYHLKTSINQSFSERVHNYLFHLVGSIYNEMVILQHVDFVARIYFPGMPNIKAIFERTTVTLINTDSITSPVQQLLPHIIPVGGLHISTPATPIIPKNLANVLEQSAKDIILLSLGKKVQYSELGLNKTCEMLRAFEFLSQYTVLWMIDPSLSIPSCTVPENVLFESEIYESSILAHSNTKLLISSANLLNIQESIWRGVPVLGLPVTLNQHMNIDKLIQLQVAESFDLKTVNARSFANTISSMLVNSQQKITMKYFAQLFRDQKEPPLERTLWWLERAMRYSGTEHRRNPYSSMHIIQRYSIDVIATVSATLVIFLVLLSTVFFWCSRSSLNYVKHPNIKIKHD